MTYARARLWTGITGVGLIVTACTLALFFQLPDRLLPQPGGLATKALGLAGLGALLSLLLLPVEWVGGFLLARTFERRAPSALTWWGGWLRGVLAQLLVLFASAALMLYASNELGRPGAILAYAGMMLVLVVVQGPLARFVGGFRRSRRSLGDGLEVEVYAGRDPAFTGGVLGLPGRDQVVVPEHWFGSIGEEGVRTLARRRDIIRRRGWRSRGLLTAAAFNLAGFTAILRFADLDPSRPTELATALLANVLVSFLGLLILPSVARRAVLAGDRAALAEGLDRQILTRSLETLDPLQDDEPERSAALESIFHPLKSLRGRLAALDDPESPDRGDWHLARNALFLSWAGLGVLARAVHCNSGKPELWVMLPAD